MTKTFSANPCLDLSVVPHWPLLGVLAFLLSGATFFLISIGFHFGKKKNDLRLKLKPKKTQECGAPDTQRENTQIHFSEAQLLFFFPLFFFKWLLETGEADICGKIDWASHLDARDGLQPFFGKEISRRDWSEGPTQPLFFPGLLPLLGHPGFLPPHGRP